MTRLALVLLLVAMIGPPLQAATEQEALDAFAQRLRSSLTVGVRDRTLHDLRASSTLLLSGDRREFEVTVARKQLAADLASAAAGLATADQQHAAQARGQFVQAVSMAVSQFQQAASNAHGQWAQEASVALGRAQQDESAVSAQTQQAVSEALQALAVALQDQALAEMLPLIEAKIPDLTGQATAIETALSAAEKAIAEARAAYQKDAAAALQACDGELEAAIALPAAADRAAAIRRAINKARVVGLDRLEQYDGEVRAALRKALLAEPG